MPYPDFYQPGQIGQQLTPTIDTAARAGRAVGASPANEDTERVYLLLIDIQIDFIHPDGALSIPGAVEDTRRTVEWIYDNTDMITKIGATLDTHLPIQIFHPPWWADGNGNHPDAMTAITADDVKSGKWKALHEPEWSIKYLEKLENDAKKTLMIWPFHVLLGTPGQALVPALSEAIAYHAAARQMQPRYFIKGLIPGSEHYSAFNPEVEVKDHPQGSLATDVLDEIASYDRIYIAGQAKSHCLLESVNSMMQYYTPEQIAKMRVLEDTMSSVAHPQIDFDALADEQFAQWQKEGLTLITTQDAG
jgi:nicotinamidase/pyrazinamidase